ncbi:MAG: single-stranded-DNA-specific exonuclease RecJ [Planctomycetes bacterium GWF2_42_9]|nr:MAG: single-stranded-DNA-specific exonuclease RecJ [Planctomycetes bacterium GWF2_42_9]
MQKKQWHIFPVQPKSASLASELKISPLLSQLLYNRQIETADQAKTFLNPKLADLIEPEQMPGIVPAVDRIEKAVKEKQKITIYGDYDVDGITAVSILLGLFKLLGAEVDYYIPHRVDEGYGLNVEAISQIAESGAKLIISVDCGITAFTAAPACREKGMDLIITDHHRPEPDGRLPEAVAIVHPHLDSNYPAQSNSGAAVAFKLAWAVVNRIKNGATTPQHLRQYLINATIFAAMGTIADVVDLRGENRIISSFGLRAIADSTMPGVEALLNVAGIKGQTIDSFHMGYCLAPVLNAAGRMGHSRLAVELLTSDNSLKALRIAEYLKEQNKQRQQMEKKIVKQACTMMAERGFDHPDRKTIVLASDDWHTGVIGIVAARLSEKYYKPTILFNISNGKTQGSARSIEGFDILEAISACKDRLNTFGGHSMAAGMTIDMEKIDDFTQAFEDYAISHWKEEEFTSKLEIDAVCSLKDLSVPAIKLFSTLGPFGRGNPAPVFAARGVRLIASPKKVGVNNDHLQLVVSDNSASIRCIGFNMAHLEKKLLENEFFNIAFEAQVDNFFGQPSVQLVLADIQFN